jgi:hypothetical protein
VQWNVPTDLQERSNPMKVYGRRPNQLDETENWIIDDDFAEGLYNGTMPGFKLASALVFPIVCIHGATYPGKQVQERINSGHA